MILINMYVWFTIFRLWLFRGQTLRQTACMHLSLNQQSQFMNQWLFEPAKSVHESMIVWSSKVSSWINDCLNQQSRFMNQWLFEPAKSVHESMIVCLNQQSQFMNHWLLCSTLNCATFQSRVRRSNHWAIPAPRVEVGKEADYIAIATLSPPEFGWLVLRENGARLTPTETIRLIRDGEKVGKGVWRGRGRLYSYRCTVTTRIWLAGTPWKRVDVGDVDVDVGEEGYCISIATLSSPEWRLR